MGGCCDRELGRYVRWCQSSFHAWQWAGDTAFTAVASVWARGASSAGGPPRMATVGRRRGRTACLMVVAIDVPMGEPDVGATAAADGRAALRC